MPKGYWIAHVDVDNPSEYDKYRAANAEALEKYGARFLVRGGAQDVREGAFRSRSVVIEFPSLEAAIACYESPEYQAAKAIRTEVSEGNMCIIEGYDP